MGDMSLCYKYRINLRHKYIMHTHYYSTPTALGLLRLLVQQSETNS